jgi:hypothetical protein
VKAALVEYDRASTVADALDTGGGLATWQTRHAALGIATNPDLAALAAALGRNLNTLTDADKRALDEIIERAHDRSGGNEKADYGTAIHSLTEPGNDGTVVIDSMTADVASYLASIDEAGIEVDATETFVVNDELKVAGTFDHAYRFTRPLEVKLNGETVTIPAGSKVIGDKKTGSLHFDAHAIQLAIYARGKTYDHRTGERGALDVSPQWGVIAHIAREGGKTTLYLVDLAAGWVGAKLAVQVRAYTLGSRKRLSVAFATREAPAAPVAIRSFEVMPHASCEARGEAAVDAPARTSPPVVRGCRSASGGRPAPPAELSIGDAVANLARAGLEPVAIDPILDEIAHADNGEQCKAIWSRVCRERGDGAWTTEHTAAVKARLAELQAAA